MKRFALVLILVLAMALPALAQEALEIGVTKEGALKDNIATFSFSASAQQIIVFELASTDFDPFLEVQAASGDVGLERLRVAKDAGFAGTLNLFDLVGLLHHRPDEAGKLGQLAAQDLFAKRDVAEHPVERILGLVIGS